MADHRTSMQAVEKARRARAIGMRMTGASVADIAKQLHYPDQQAVYRDLNEQLSENTVHAFEHDQELLLDLSRLDALLKACWKKAMTGDEKAISNALRILGRRARMLGLDKPARHEVRHGVTDEAERLGDMTELMEVILRSVERYPDASAAIFEAFSRTIDGKRRPLEVLDGELITPEPLPRGRP